MLVIKIEIKQLPFRMVTLMDKMFSVIFPHSLHSALKPYYDRQNTGPVGHWYRRKWFKIPLLCRKIFPRHRIAMQLPNLSCLLFTRHDTHLRAPLCKCLCARKCMLFVCACVTDYFLFLLCLCGGAMAQWFGQWTHVRRLMVSIATQFQ